MRILFAALALLSTPVLAQTKAAIPPQQASTPGLSIPQILDTALFRSGQPKSTSFTPDEKTVFFLRNAPDSKGQRFFAFDVATGQTREFLTPEALLQGAEETRSPEEKARREHTQSKPQGFSFYASSEDGEKLLVGLSGKLYVVARPSGKVMELKTGPGASSPSFSRDGKQLAYVRDNDVYRLDLATNTEHRVTTGGTPEKTHGQAEFIAQEEMHRFSGYWWSPDAKALAYEEADTSGVEKLAIVDATHPEQGAQQLSYPRAGKANAQVRLGVIPVAGGKTTWVHWDAEKYPYLASVSWPKQGPLMLLVQNRTQTEELLLAADVKTGSTRPLLEETDEAWLDLDPTFPWWLEDGSGFLWYTDRHGAPEVELHDASGKLVRSLVPPEAGFRQLVGYVEKEDTLYFLGGPDSPESYLWRVQSGSKPARVTTGGPALESARMSRQGGLFILSSEGPTSIRHTFVVKADGTRVGELPSLAKEPPFQPRLEVRQVGKEGFWTSLVRPRNAKPGVKLPVIVEIYGAPGITMVHQSLSEHLLAQWMADQGFLVVRLDGRGTLLAASAKERKPKYEFARILLDEQVAALRALAAQVPEMDLDRVGITGGSHGGYMSALAVLIRPEVFKAAVAMSAVADWRDYDTHLTERLLGLPQEHPEAYEQSSLLTHVKAGQPMGKLLIIHGTADDNVLFTHALKLSDALFRAGQPHEFLPVNGMGHLVFAPPVSDRVWERTMDFFKQHLRGPGAPTAPGR